MTFPYLSSAGPVHLVLALAISACIGCDAGGDTGCPSAAKFSHVHPSWEGNTYVRLSVSCSDEGTPYSLDHHREMGCQMTWSYTYEGSHAFSFPCNCAVDVSACGEEVHPAGIRGVNGDWAFSRIVCDYPGDYDDVFPGLSPPFNGSGTTKGVQCAGMSCDQLRVMNGVVTCNGEPW